MLWKKLVTEGHVRGARLRAAQPTLLLLAILLCVIGGYGAIRIKPPPSKQLEQQGSQEEIRAQVQQINDVFSKIPALTLDRPRASKLAPAFEVQRITKIITDQLDENGKLPEILPLQKISQDEFWGFNWSVENLQHYKNGNIILVGAIVSDERKIAPRQARPPIRWIGLFRKNKGQWLAYSLRFPNGYVSPDNSQMIRPTDYPKTFARLLPDAKEVK